MATFQPARAKRRARALPRPLAPPVMAMRWLGKRFMVSSCCFCFTPLSQLGRGVGGEGPSSQATPAFGERLCRSSPFILFLFYQVELDIYESDWTLRVVRTLAPSPCIPLPRREREITVSLSSTSHTSSIPAWQSTPDALHRGHLPCAAPVRSRTGR